jgi:hypothetical protein
MTHWKGHVFDRNIHEGKNHVSSSTALPLPMLTIQRETTTHYKKMCKLKKHLQTELDKVIDIRHRLATSCSRRDSYIEKTIQHLWSRIHQVTHDLGKIEEITRDTYSDIPMQLTELPLREWKRLDTMKDKNLDNFTLMVYNVLAESYALPHYYPRCPEWILHWRFRFRKIIQDITHLAPEIICLQVNKEPIHLD